MTHFASSLRSLLLGAVAATALSAAQAAPFADPRADAPRALGKATVVASFDVGNFLENLVVEGNEAIVTDYVAKTLFRVNLDTGARSTIAKFEGHIGALVSIGSGYWLVPGWTADGRAVVQTVDDRGRIAIVAHLPEGAFPNGATRLDNGTFLIGDSARGEIYRFDLKSAKVSTWLRHEVLAPVSVTTPMIPGVNGIRRHGGFVYAANMQRKTLSRIHIARDGSAGAIEPVADRVFIDDFAVGDDGTVYAATHLFDSVIKIEPGGAVTTVADHGSGLRGPTAVAFGPRRGRSLSLIVTNNGQLYIPPPSGPENGRLIRIDLQEKQAKH